MSLADLTRWKRQVDDGNKSSDISEMSKTISDSLWGLEAEWLAQGGVLLFLLALAYIALALHLLAKYFILPCIDVVTAKTDSTPSVAGTLIVGGITSTLAFVTTIIGSLVAMGDIGIGKTVGPHIYDHTVIVALSLLCVSYGLQKQMAARTLLRDAVFIILINILIVFFFMDSVLVWYESALLSAIFLVYLLTVRLLRQFMTIESAVQTQPAGEANENQLELAEPVPAEAEKYQAMKMVPEADSSCLARFTHYLTLPIKAAMWVTIPSPAWTCCKVLTWTTIFPATLLMSLLWQALLGYLMVGCGQVVGSTLGVPPEVTGLVLLSPITLDIMICGLLAGRGDLAMAVHSIFGRSIIHLSLTLGISSLLFNVVFMKEIEVDASCWPYPIIMMALSITLLFLVVVCTRGKPARWWFIAFIILFLLHMVAALAFSYGWIVCPV